MDTKLALTLGCFVLAALYLVRARRKASRYPPGPRGWPLIGNLLDMPGNEEWLQYRNWAHEFKSDIIHLEALGTHIVVLNSVEAISDLLDKRSAIYSSRPETPMMDLMGWSWLVTFMPHNPRWKSQRRHFRQEFDGGAIKRHIPTITNSTHNMLRHFLETPEKWNEHLHHMTATTIMELTYGIKVSSVNDPYIEMAEAAVEAGSQAMVSGAYLVNVFPMLKHVPAWMPGAGFQKEAKVWKKHLDEIFEAPFAAVKTAMANGTARSCFTVRHLEEAEAGGHDGLLSEEHSIQSAAAGMYISGSDTTRAFLDNFILAMVLHPEAQKAAQAELDAVLGSGRLPTLADQESLPYLAAMMRESWRWEIALPLALPHMLTADDEYKGYLIPKGTIVFPNSYSVMNDEMAYPEPAAFRPERFLKDGKIDQSVRNPTGASFGYGRRVCPGRALAEPAVWLAAACILTLFDISKAVDLNGAPIEPSCRFRPGFLRRLEAFECQIKPRSTASPALIRSIKNLVVE